MKPKQLFNSISTPIVEGLKTIRSAFRNVAAQAESGTETILGYLATTFLQARLRLAYQLQDDADKERELEEEDTELAVFEHIVLMEGPAAPAPEFSMT